MAGKSKNKSTIRHNLVGKEISLAVLSVVLRSKERKKKTKNMPVYFIPLHFSFLLRCGVRATMAIYLYMVPLLLLQAVGATALLLLLPVTPF